MEIDNENVYLGQINEILDFLKDQKTRKSALDLLLGFTDSEQMRGVFLKTDICKIMIRQLEDESSGNRELVLQILINLSSDEMFINTFLNLNSLFRISNLIFQKIDQYLPKESTKTLCDPLEFIIPQNTTSTNVSNNKIEIAYSNYIFNFI
jgi:hypothetical protein